MGASSDLSHVVFESEQALTSNAVEGEPNRQNLYEWSGGQLQLVSVLPRRRVGSCGTWRILGAGGGQAYYRGDPVSVTSHAVSNDGSRVIWGKGATS